MLTVFVIGAVSVVGWFHPAAALAQTAPTTEPDSEIGQTKGNIYKTRDANYKSGAWEYQYWVSGRASRGAGKHGKLLYAGKELPAPAGINDYYKTPWGAMYWVGQNGPMFVPHGWMLLPAEKQPEGKLLPEPAEGGSKPPASQPASKG
jgi:hypothetical protein